jgi:hypothetical protein
LNVSDYEKEKLASKEETRKDSPDLSSKSVPPLITSEEQMLTSYLLTTSFHMNTTWIGDTKWSITGSETASWLAHKNRVTGGIFNNSATNSDAIL